MGLHNFMLRGLIVDLGSLEFFMVLKMLQNPKPKLKLSDRKSVSLMGQGLASVTSRELSYLVQRYET